MRFVLLGALIAGCADEPDPCVVHWEPCPGPWASPFGRDGVEGRATFDVAAGYRGDVGPFALGASELLRVLGGGWEDETEVRSSDRDVLDLGPQSWSDGVYGCEGWLLPARAVAPGPVDVTLACPDGLLVDEMHWSVVVASQLRIQDGLWGDPYIGDELLARVEEPAVLEGSLMDASGRELSGEGSLEWTVDGAATFGDVSNPSTSTSEVGVAVVLWPGREGDAEVRARFGELEAGLTVHVGPP